MDYEGTNYLLRALDVSVIDEANASVESGATGQIMGPRPPLV